MMLPGEIIMRARMVDWQRAFILGSSILLLLFVCLVILSGKVKAHQNEEVAMFGLAALSLLILSPILLRTHFLGFAFNSKSDRLTYPTILFRRSIALSEIHDADGQYLGELKFPGMSDTTTGKDYPTIIRRYAINLSGEFGSRQLKFWSRKKRDQFLSLLRSYAPECRITRGYSY